MTDVNDLNKDEKAMKAILAKLYQILTGGDDVASASADNYIAWCTPGIPYESEDLAFGAEGPLGGDDADETRELLAQASDFATLVNFVPSPAGVYTKDMQDTTYEHGGTLIWNVYDQVLRYSEVADSKLTAKEKEKIKKFRGLLWQKKKEKDLITDEEKEVVVMGPVLEAYKKKESDYLDAVHEYNNKRISALNSDSKLHVQDWALNASSYRRRVKVAMDEWISGGYKNDVEKMHAYIDQVSKRDLHLLKDMLTDQLEKGKLTDQRSGLDFYTTSFVPSGFASNPKGWTKFTFEEKNVKQYERNEVNAFQASAKASFGPLGKLVGGVPGFIVSMFGVHVEGDARFEKREKSIDVSNLKLEFELTQVPIVRPWFSPEFLKNTAWRWRSNMGMAPLSDGKKPPDGQLVAYPTTAVFARNIVVDFDELHDRDSSFSQNIKAGIDVSFGPFKLGGGSFERSVGKRTFTSNIGKEGLKAEGMQIIAFKCSLLPKSPNPSDEIEKWS